MIELLFPRNTGTLPTIIIPTQDESKAHSIIFWDSLRALKYFKWWGTPWLHREIVRQIEVLQPHSCLIAWTCRYTCSSSLSVDQGPKCQISKYLGSLVSFPLRSHRIEIIYFSKLPIQLNHRNRLPKTPIIAISKHQLHTSLHFFHFSTLILTSNHPSGRNILVSSP